MAVDVPRIIVLVFLLLFLFFSPNTRTPSPSQQRELADQILLEKHALDLLNTSVYGGLDATKGRWLNLTGLKKDDNYSWERLPEVQERAKEQFRVIFDATRLPGGASNESGTSSGIAPSIEDSKGSAEGVLSSMTNSDKFLRFYQNATGIIRGQWSRSKVGRLAHWAHPLNLTALAPDYTYASQEFKRNITGFSGDLRIKLEERSSDELTSEPGQIRGIKAEMLIKDESSSGDGWDIVMYGVHYPQQGGMIFSTTSEKFAGIFALPHFTLSKRAFSLAQQLLNQTLNPVIKKQEESLETILNPWTSSPNNPSDAFFPTARCEYIVYIQQHPIEDPKTDVKEVEQELRFPTGAPLRSTPGMKMSALIFSPDCGFVLESKGPPDYPPQQGAHLNGPKLESFVTMAKRAILAFALLVSAQIFLLKRQMRDTSTPSTRSRVSLYTIAMMAMGDGFAFMGCIVAGMFIESLFLPLISTGFASFVCVSFFGMKFLMDIWTVQAPERQEREREQQRARDRRIAEAAARNPQPSTATPVTVPITTPAGADTLPLPATARRTPNNVATPVILPPDQDLDATAAEDLLTNPNGTAIQPQPTALTSARREIGALYTKFYFLLLTILFLSLHATSWPLALRSLYCNTLAFIYLSLWCPQIYRNVMRNCRKALRWEFVIGESILRLIPFAYFYCYEDNVLFVTIDPNAFYALAGWVWIQFCALVSQEILGPRFFVKEGWAPPAYDYHPILREDSDGESGSLLPIGFTEARTVVGDPMSPTSRTDSAGPSSPMLGRQNTGGSISTTSSRRKSKKDGKLVFQCAICTEDLEVPVVPSEGSASENDVAGAMGREAAMIFSRRAYMVTPCRHIFHSACLEGWMRYRLQCPNCRENLPPL